MKKEMLKIEDIKGFMLHYEIAATIMEGEIKKLIVQYIVGENSIKFIVEFQRRKILETDSLIEAINKYNFIEEI